MVQVVNLPSSFDELLLNQFEVVDLSNVLLNGISFGAEILGLLLEPCLRFQSALMH